MRKNNKKIIIILVGVIAVIGIFVILGFKESDRIIARYTTYEHYRYSPIVLDNNIYFPSSFSDKDIKEPKTIGLLGAKDKGWFVDCFASTGAVIVDDNDKEKNKIKVIDDFPMTYIKGQYLSDVKIIEENINKYERFVLCNDSNKGEEDFEVRVSIEKEYLLELVKKFGQVEINNVDYINADDIFYIYVDSPDQKIHERTFDKPIVYIGTIFMKNNKLYYGNFSNEIKDQLYDDFMDKYANLIQGKKQ